MEPSLPSVSFDHLTSWFQNSAQTEHPERYTHTAMVASILAFASSNGAEKMSVSCDCRALRIACRNHAAMNNVSHPRAQPGSAQVGKVWVISQFRQLSGSDKRGNAAAAWSATRTSAESVPAPATTSTATNAAAAPVAATTGAHWRVAILTATLRLCYDGGSPEFRFFQLSSALCKVDLRQDLQDDLARGHVPPPQGHVNANSTAGTAWHW